LQNDAHRPAASAPERDVLAALRAATAERHRVIDRSMPLSRPSPTVADYIDHLRLMRAWLQPLERWLEDSGVYAEPKALPTPQTSLIDVDLAAAGIQLEGEQAGTGTRRWPIHAGVSYQWGARYVIEGSRLGAAVLYRRLSNALHPHELRYLQGGNGTSADRWPKFLCELRASVKAPAEIEQACEGACDSFDALLAMPLLERSTVPPASGHS
jgi:heme oxygenase